MQVFVEKWENCSLYPYVGTQSLVMLVRIVFPIFSSYRCYSQFYKLKSHVQVVTFLGFTLHSYQDLMRNSVGSSFEKVYNQNFIQCARLYEFPRKEDETMIVKMLVFFSSIFSRAHNKYVQNSWKKPIRDIHK